MQYSFNKTLQDIFVDQTAGTIDTTELYQILVVYANQFLNKVNDDVSLEERNEMMQKAHDYELDFIVNFKKNIIEKDFKGYSEGEKAAKEFEKLCKEVCRENWDEFFVVLDWVKDNFNWEKGDHYFEKFANFADNEPTLINDYYFTEYTRDLGEDAYLSHLKRDDPNNPIFDFIDWDDWASCLMDDYTEIENPLKQSRNLYYTSY